MKRLPSGLGEGNQEWTLAKVVEADRRRLSERKAARLATKIGWGGQLKERFRQEPYARRSMIGETRTWSSPTHVLELLANILRATRRMRQQRPDGVEARSGDRRSLPGRS